MTQEEERCVVGTEMCRNVSLEISVEASQCLSQFISNIQFISIFSIPTVASFPVTPWILQRRRLARALMADGTMFDTIDIYASLLHHMSDDRWKQPIERYFHHSYSPLDPDEIDDTIQKFASQHGFVLYDMTERLHGIRTMVDLVKLYSTCVKLALLKPKTLFCIVSNLRFPKSLSVMEGLFALRKYLVSGSLNVLFKKKGGATDKEKKCMHGRCYDLVLFQSDNIVTLSNNTIPEILRQLECLVTECPICLERLTDIDYGSINYPFACGHAFHYQCVGQCNECPTCRTTHKMKGVVTFELKHVL